LAPVSEGRLRDAGELARELTAYLESVETRLRQAELERAEAQGKAAEERKRRRAQLALAGAILFLVVGLGLGGWLWQQQRQAQQHEADQATAGAIHEAREKLVQAQAAPLGDAGRFREALAAALHADKLAHTSAASEEVRRQAAELVESVKNERDAAVRDQHLLAALWAARATKEALLLRSSSATPDTTELVVDEELRAAFRAWGLDVDRVPSEEAARLRARPPAVVVEVVAALDHWAEQRRTRTPQGDWQRLAKLAEALDEDPSGKRRELRAMLARGNLARERTLALLSMALRPVPVPCDPYLGKDRVRLRDLVNTTVPSAEPVLGLLTLVQALEVAGDEGTAERLLRSALRSRPQEVLLYNALGELLRSQNRAAEAVECFTAARALRPELGLVLALLLVSTNRPEEGLALLEHLSASWPEAPFVHFARGWALGELHRYPEAQEAYQEAIRHKPDHAPFHEVLGWLLMIQGKWEEAERACRRAVDLNSKSAGAYCGLGIALASQGKWKDAETAFRQAIPLEPNDPTLHFDLGWALENQGQWKGVAAAYQKAIELRPDYADAHERLAVARSHLPRDK
jgi:tetratricopeptide (TPR) repeat protein